VNGSFRYTGRSLLFFGAAAGERLQGRV
jgi:hypothetical protein